MQIFFDNRLILIDLLLKALKKNNFKKKDKQIIKKINKINRQRASL